MATTEAPSAVRLSSQDLLSLQAATLESRNAVEAARGASSWLKPSLQTEKGTSQVFELLEHHVERAEFLGTITTAREHVDNHSWVCGNTQCSLQLEEVEQQWAHVTRTVEPVPCAAEEAVEVGTESLSGSYVLVNKEEALEAMGTFIAAYIAAMPEAKNMSPEQLQGALCTTFQELRKGRIQHAWEWGRALYRAAAVSYAAFSMYTNPWLAMAIVKATWAAARFLLAGIL